MLSFVRSWSHRTEFFAVVGVGFGYFILSNLLYLLIPSARAQISDDSLRFLVAFEILVLSVLGALLYARGWRLSRISPPLALSDAIFGLGLALASYAIYLAAAIAAVTLAGTENQLTSVEFVDSDIRLTTLIVASTVNPLFEELLLCGYVVTVLKERRGLWVAVNTSLAIRLACHLYQGPVGVIAIVPLGFVFTYWYARTGRLWPVVLAHAIVDCAGLSPYLSD